MVRPSPVPPRSREVVKNGSNTWTAFAAEIPGPSSLTATSTPPSASWRASMAT